MPTVSTQDTITLAVSVTDRARTAAWFKQHFGFEEVFSIDEAGWTELATHTPGVTLGFGDAESVAPSSTVPVFGVGDCDAARSALEAEGVRFDGETLVIPDMVKLATFFDPDGNPFMLAETLSA